MITRQWTGLIGWVLALSLMVFSVVLMAAEGARPAMGFNHDQTTFPLTGIHTNTACESCHIKGVFKGTPNTCTGCHSRGGAVIAQMKPSSHIPVTQDCSVCHKTLGWIPALFSHNQLKQACSTCHNGTSQTGKPATHVATVKDCGECHKTTAWVPAGYDHSGVVPGSCSTCHNGSTATGKPARHIRTNQQCDTCHKTFTAWTPAGYAHEPTDTNCQSCHNGSTATGKAGGHVATTEQCSVCHNQTAWIPTSFTHTVQQLGGRSCNDCHNGTNATGLKSGHIPTGGQQCSVCHTTTWWTPTSFDHSKVTTAGSCTNCHNGVSATGKKSTHIPTTGYPQCDSCHNTSAWKPTSFAHGNISTGSNCATCHNGVGATGRPTTGAKAHNTAPMTANTCGSCHTIGSSWAPATMNHTGAASCATCHAIGSAGNLWTPGKTGHISTTGHAQCSDCHTTSVWKPSTFSHQGITKSSNCTVSCHNGSNATGRPTSGAKAHTVSPLTSTSCGSCHSIGNSWIPATMNHTGVTSCTSCHAYTGNSWTPFKTGHISTTAQCSSCHTSTAWLPANFSHTTVGVNAATNCAQSGCHDISNAAVPRAGRPTSGTKAHAVTPMTGNSCGSCHAIGTAWAPATMNHSGATGCSSCHTKSGDTWTPTPTTTHITTTTECSSCHSTTKWAGATFSHNNVTSATSCTQSGCHDSAGASVPRAGRPTSGTKAHTTAPLSTGNCGSCHAVGTVWTPATMDHTGLATCTSCHATTGNGFTPAKANHISTTGYAQCSSCHTTTAWKPTSFDHTGITSTANCTTCHNGTAATGRPITGAKAHTVSPMTSTTCGTCHTSFAAWVPTTMNHTGVTNCTSCHAIGVSGNSWTPGKSNHIATTGYAQCSSCHTVSAWLPTSFAHSGVTSGQNCTTCHNGTSATGLPTSGAKAHLVAPMTSNTCGSCHTIGTAWTPATMNHTGVTNCSSCHAYSGNGFTIAKANHVSTTSQCSACHTTTGWKPATVTHNSVTSSTNCYNGCHDGTHATGTSSATGTKAHTVAPMTSVTCGSCHAIGSAWAPATMNHTGATSCSSCHSKTGNSWTPTPATTHITTSAQCSSCHTTTVWKSATFDHSTFGVSTATDCTQSGCHSTANAATPKAGRPTSGAKAHTTAPMTGNTCGSCHAIGASWAPTTMNHTGATSCSSCHSKTGNSWTITPATTHITTTSECSSCHATAAWKPATGTHNGVTSATNCTTGCHNGTSATGRPTSGTKAHTIAPLTDNTCGSCHSIGTTWTPATMNHTGLTSCTSCHATAGNGFTPAKANHISTTGYAQCSSCHLTSAWLPTSFSHSGVTSATDCTACHNGTNASGTPTGAKAHITAPMTANTCANCHNIGGGWAPATMNHTGATGCTSCHVTAGNNWTPAKANHISTSGYTQCSSCHLTTAWLPTSFAHTGITTADNCTACHNGTAATGRPVSGAKAHTVSPMTSTTCGSCHTIGTAWAPATMDHTGVTSCTSCHTYSGNGFTPAKVNHISTTSQCSACHTTTAWPTTFNHAANGVTTASSCTQAGCHDIAGAAVPKAGRPISGTTAHSFAPMTGNTCGNCHTVGGNWTTVTMNHTGASSCSSCHSKAGNTWTPITKNSGGGWTHITTSSECSVCHTTSKFFPATNVHNGVSTSSNCTSSGCHSTPGQTSSPQGKPLNHSVAPMTSTSCGSCHSIGTVWLPATMNHTGATSCTSCHATAGNAFTPAKANHISTTGYAQCSSCHTTTAWLPTSFTHNGVTASTNCATCHNGTSASGRPVTGAKAHTAAPLTNNTCGSCHTIGTAWAPATMNHTGATSCTSCHVTSGNGFTPAKANHISTTGYAQCSSCHTTTLWVPTSFNHSGITSASNCTTCHNGTAASGTPTGAKAHIVAPMTSTTCGSCHTIGTAWAPATMNHTGATSCTSCHTTAGNGFTPAKANHIPTTGYAQCSSCHMTSAWLPTSFNHSGITSASDCTTCHNGTAASGRPTGAKAHITAPMTSNMCANCHSIGTAWAPATMNHTGATSCTSCHSTAGNGFTPAKANHIPTTGYAQCSSCHLTTAWLPTSFNHTGITSGCSNCHNGSSATGPTSSHAGISPSTCNSCHKTTAWLPPSFAHTGITTNCTNCHKAGFAATKSASHFITTQGCEKCHTTTAWVPMKSYVHTSTYYKTHSGLSMSIYADCKLCHIGNNELISGAPHLGNAAYKPDCAWCHATQYKAGSHKKTETPTTTYYTVAELKNCSGACHMISPAKTRNGPQHRSTDGGF